MMKQPQTPPRGFTLIELMVAMAIAMIALLAVSQLYINSRQTFNLLAMQNRVSEDGRFALAMLQRTISQAGFRPNPNQALPTNHVSSDSAGTITVRFNADGVNQMDCAGGVAAAGPTELTIARSGSKLQCGSTDWLAPSDGGGGNATEVVDFRLSYGVDDADNDAGGNPRTPAEYGCGADLGAMRARDCVANRFVDTLAGISADQLVAVKVCLVLRSEKTDRTLIKAAGVSNCSNAEISGSQDDQKLYRMFQTTVLLRNR
ncbi:PilW family protein [Chitinilyticum litopenaei]|uniref:PilW family protein n=1 Tax=Chitinilyticum litopenaei TaxID=1121276 RepID=UPI0004150035|nr:PilW family protein [Chitinilyticum litopenaei]